MFSNNSWLASPWLIMVPVARAILSQIVEQLLCCFYILGDVFSDGGVVDLFVSVFNLGAGAGSCFGTDAFVAFDKAEARTRGGNINAI